MFSVGILYSAQEFLEFINSTPNLDLRFPDIFKSFSIASPKAILEVSQRCEWIILNIDGYLEVSERGKQILECKEAKMALRVQIGHLIETYLPAWIPLLNRGRTEARHYLPLDVSQCFLEAGLFEEITDEIVNWWDKYSKISRRISKDLKLDLGRLGEKLSLKHERQRTLREPYWQGFESNLSGYDILSCVSIENPTLLRIEVKTSNSIAQVAVFHVSRNEWQVASTSEHYIFHLWTLQPKPELFVLYPDQICCHIPQDQGNGNWESVIIPFASF